MKNLVVYSFLLLASFSCAEKQPTEFESAFVHSVYFWLKNPDSAQDRAAFEKSLQHFLDNSLFAKTNFIGTPPKATRSIVDDTYTYNLIVTFASAEDQDAYQKEVAHLRFIEESEHLWNKVQIYDALGVRK